MHFKIGNFFFFFEEFMLNKCFYIKILNRYTYYHKIQNETKNIKHQIWPKSIFQHFLASLKHVI